MVARPERLAELMALPDAERAEFAARLIASLDPPTNTAASAWDAEIERRAREDDDETADLIDADVVLRDVRATIPAS